MAFRFSRTQTDAAPERAVVVPPPIDLEVPATLETATFAGG